jgi:hypothetical protein
MVTVYSIPNSGRSIRKIDNFLPSPAEAWYCFSESPRSPASSVWYSLLAELISGGRERSGERKAGALFEIGIHNLSARDGVEAVFRAFSGHNPLKRLNSEK